MKMFDRLFYVWIITNKQSVRLKNKCLLKKCMKVMDNWEDRLNFERGKDNDIYHCC
mgnify:FL=1